MEAGKFTHEILGGIYYDLKNPLGYTPSAKDLLKEAKKKGANLTLNDVKLWLRKQIAHTRHATIKNKFPRRKVLVLRIDNTWSADLIQIDALKNYNAGYQYILNCTDLFSRKKWLRKLKTKSKKEMEEALESIIQENDNRAPFRLWTDRGKEFLSLPDFYAKHEIHRYSTNSPLKSVYVENSNKAVENLLYKAMTSLQTAKWINLLEDVAEHLNSKKSNVLYGMSPNEAHKKSNEEYLRAKFLEIYKKHKAKYKNQKPKFQLGDTVRIKKDRTVFSRGYEPGYSQDIHVISDIQQTYPVTYKIEGQRRVYYEQELVHAAAPSKEIEKQYYIERTRRINTKKHRSGAVSGGETQYLLKAKNDANQSGWISEFEYQRLKDGGILSE